MLDQRPGTLTPSRERLREAAKTLFAERGYESTSTVTICRLAGTSESQLIKHYGGKQGVLEAIFEHAWGQINPALHLATESIPSPRDKFRVLLEMVFNFLEKDEELSTLFLLESRRLRDDGHMIVLVPGFLEFVKVVDGILKELADRNELATDVPPQAFRSALIGAAEGMLRDRMLARTSGFPASYSDSDVRTMALRFLSCALSA